jgi:hypothetical protein
LYDFVYKYEFSSDPLKLLISLEITEPHSPFLYLSSKACLAWVEPAGSISAGFFEVHKLLHHDKLTDSLAADPSSACI